MGTKNAPGDFDCYANAEPDEPMFVLLGRDPVAASVVTFWTMLRQYVCGSEDKHEEALSCALAMEAWARAKGKSEAVDKGLRRADALLNDVTIEALDEIAKLCGCETWEYSGQVVRDVQGVIKCTEDMTRAGAALSNIAYRLSQDPQGVRPDVVESMRHAYKAWDKAVKELRGYLRPNNASSPVDPPTTVPRQ